MTSVTCLFFSLCSRGGPKRKKNKKSWRTLLLLIPTAIWMALILQSEAVHRGGMLTGDFNWCKKSFFILGKTTRVRQDIYTPHLQRARLRWDWEKDGKRSQKKKKNLAEINKSETNLSFISQNLFQLLTSESSMPLIVRKINKYFKTKATEPALIRRSYILKALKSDSYHCDLTLSTQLTSHMISVKS